MKKNKKANGKKSGFFIDGMDCGRARLISSDGSAFEIAGSLLPDGAKEGDCVEITTVLTPPQESEENFKYETASLLDGLGDNP